MNTRNLIIGLTGKVPFGLRNLIKHIPILKQMQAWLLKKWLHQSEFNATISGGPAKGLVFPVQMPQDKLMWIGTWELPFAEALQKAVKPGWVCYDIGGYKGYYAGVMALRGAKEVYVFEPMPANAEKIKSLIQLNSDLNINLKQVAVTDREGAVAFKIMPEETMGKLESSNFQLHEQATRALTVEAVSLDVLILKGLPEPDIIKIDVEGAEESVLRGGAELIKRKKPYMMIEVHSPEIGKGCMDFLSQHYSSIYVLETGKLPGVDTPAICHYVAHN